MGSNFLELSILYNCAKSRCADAKCPLLTMFLSLPMLLFKNLFGQKAPVNADIILVWTPPPEGTDVILERYLPS